MADDTTKSPLWPADNQAVIAYINLLQGIINRLAGNSASCKTWCLGLVGTLLSLAGTMHAPGVVPFAFVAIVIFGFLDTMYLAQERAYRRRYMEVIGKINSETLTRKDIFDARAPIGSKEIFLALGSWSICPLYLALIVGYGVAAAAGWLPLLAAPGK